MPVDAETNPWIEPEEMPAPVPAKRRDRLAWRAGADVAHVAHLPMVDRPGDLFVVGAHGGAGTSTLAPMLGAIDAGCSWPVGDGAQRCLVVARTHARGLEAAQRCAIQWASGAVPVHLVGLILVADGPKPVRALKDRIRLVSGAFPAVWHVDWEEAWRSALPGECLPTRQVKKIRHTVEGPHT